MFYRLFILYLTLPHCLPRDGRAKFGVGRRARYTPPRRMKTFVGGDKLGSPAKQRSRSISTRKREVVKRIHLLTANTYLRTLSIAVALSKIGEKRNCHRHSLVFHKYPHPRTTRMFFCTPFDTSYRLQKFRVRIRISNNCKQRETPVAKVPTYHSPNEINHYL